MPTFTLAILQARTLDQLDGNSGEFTPNNLTLAINQGLYFLNIATGFSQTTIAVPGNTVAGQLTYATPTGILIPTTVSWEGEEIERYSLERLARAFPETWFNAGSSVFGPPARWSSIGTKRFVIHPQDSTGGNLLEVSGIANITPLVNPGDTIMLEDEFADIIVMYAKVRVLLKETGKAFQDAVAQWKPMAEKIRSMSIWQGAQWPLQGDEKRTNQASGRWPR